MSELKFVIEAKSPLLFPGQNGNPNSESTLDFIPGSSILGVFAHAFIKKNKLGHEAHQNTDFKRLFLSGQTRFIPAYITEKQNDKYLEYIPAPLSIQKEKSQERYLDMLIDIDDGNFSPVGGYIQLDGENFKHKSVHKQLLYHQVRQLKDAKVDLKQETELRYQSDPVPFTYESIRAGQYFIGSIKGTDSDLQIIQSLISNGTHIRLGRSRQIHYGQAQLHWLSQPTNQAQVKSSSRNISLTLLSDTIIYDDLGVATLNIDALQQYLPNGVTLSSETGKLFVRGRLQEQFITAWGHRRPSEMSFQAGSCFWLECNVEALEQLQELQQKGLGERLAEGFGQIALGLQTESELKLCTNPRESKTKKPTNSPPALIQTIITKNLEQKYYQKVELLAFQHASGLKKLPAKSLLGRLEQTLRNGGLKAYKEAIKSTRDTAKKQLEKCRNEKETLLTILNVDITSTVDWSNNYPKIREPFLKAGLQLPEPNTENLNEHYYLSLLARLRKLKLKNDQGASK